MVNYSSSNKTIFQIPTTSLKINGSNSRYPVGRVFCIGTNYQNHAVEMGSSLTSEPTFFMKPFNSVCQIDELTLPDNAKNVHHEVELVVCLKAGGKNINLKDAKKYIYGYFLESLAKHSPGTVFKNSNKPFIGFNKPLDKTKKLFKDTENFSSVDIKEFCLIYIMINNLNFFYQRSDLLESIKFYKKENGLIFDQILECIKNGNLDYLQIDNQLLDQIEKYANITWDKSKAHLLQ